MRLRHYNLCTTSTTKIITISYKLMYVNVGAVLEYDSGVRHRKLFCFNY